MVILDYASTDHDHVAVWTGGFLECIRFQNHFYGFNRAFRQLKEAVESCRYDMDYGSLISIVVVHSDRCELWSRLSPEIPVVPKSLLNGTFPQPSPSGQGKAQNPSRSWSQAIPADAYLVDVGPSPRRSLFYHGARPCNALQA
ncbi:MAG: hypothetical protein ACUVRV_08335 [Cyanobacteriota bacterium]